MTSRKTIKIEAGGDVQFSADEVGRDKIVNQPTSEATDKPEKKAEKATSIVSTITRLVGGITKAAAAIKALLKL